MTQMRQLRDRILGPSRPVESLVRNILSFGFLVLLLLVVGVGYRSVRSLEQLERESVRVDDVEERHLRVILNISETAGKIVPEAREVIAKPSGIGLAFVSRQRLGQLKNEMDSEIEQARATSLVDSEEWSEFEAAYKDFWAGIDQAGPGSDAWHEQRERMIESVKRLDAMVDREREQNNLTAHQMSLSARWRIITATGAVLLVGIVVAALAFYEIRKNLGRLAGAYAASAESRDYLQSLLDSLVSGVVVIGHDGIVQTTSDSFRKLPGVEAEEPGGQSYRHLFRNNPSLLAAVEEQLSSPSPSNHYYGRVDLGQRLFDVFASPLSVAGEHHGLILVFVDVTDTARAQAELRRNHALAAVGQMTAQIAHEIKNPLGSIRFAAEFLRRQGSTKQTGDLSTIQIIERSVDHLAAIVTQLSDFARPKELNRTEVNVNDLLDELLPMVADRLTAKQIEVHREYDRNIPWGLYDATELKKLFLNLIINAIEASEADSSLVLRTRLDWDEQIMVDIVDHGAGMDAQTRRRLFEPFYTTKEKGTGLGMAISKQIAELHNGDLAVTSQVGEGTTVSVRLPTKLAEVDNTMSAVQRHSR